MTPRARTTLVVGVVAGVLLIVAITTVYRSQASRFPDPPVDHPFTDEIHLALIEFERGDLTKAELNARAAVSYRTSIEKLCDCGKLHGVDPDAHAESCAWQRFYVGPPKSWIRRCEEIHRTIRPGD